MASQDVEVAGYRVQAGTMLVVRTAVQRDPVFWNGSADFDPDRFSPERLKERDRWQYLPFGGGTTVVHRRSFRDARSYVGLATLIRRAESISQDGDFPLAVPFAMVADGPNWARVNRRHG